MKIAIIHEWFVNYAGSEKVVEQMLNCFPNAELFAIIENLPSNEKFFIKNKPVNTSFLQRIPFAKTKHRLFLPLMPLAVEQFDLTSFDVVISSSHAVAKGVLTSPHQLHICYCHSPMRYAWDMQHQYLKESNAETGVKSWLIRYLLHKIRIWDYRTANGVDYFVANSNFIAKRIKKIYGRESVVIHPPVDNAKFTPCLVKQDFYFTASRLVAYKKIDLIAEAFIQMPEKQLIIAGTGPDADKLKLKIKNAPNITYVGFVSDEDMVNYMQQAKAFLFAAEEDFGIIPIEAQACATPVIAFGRGGVVDSIHDGKTGILFDTQTSSAIVNAVNRFEQSIINLPDCVDNATNFSNKKFCDKFAKFVLDKYQDFKSNK